MCERFERKHVLHFRRADQRYSIRNAREGNSVKENDGSRYAESEISDDPDPQLDLRDDGLPSNSCSIGSNVKAQEFRIPTDRHGQPLRN